MELFTGSVTGHESWLWVRLGIRLVVTTLGSPCLVNKHTPPPWGILRPIYDWKWLPSSQNIWSFRFLYHQLRVTKVIVLSPITSKMTTLFFSKSRNESMLLSVFSVLNLRTLQVIKYSLVYKMINLFVLPIHGTHQSITSFFNFGLC